MANETVYFLLDTAGVNSFVAFSLLTCIQAEINVFQVYMQPSWIFHPVTPRLVVQHCHYFHWIAGPRKHRYSRWNFVAIFCTRGDKCISSLEAAILDFPLPVASGSFTSISIGMGVPENVGIVVEIMSLFCIAAEILLGNLSPPPPISKVRP